MGANMDIDCKNTIMAATCGLMVLWALNVAHAAQDYQQINSATSSVACFVQAPKTAKEVKSSCTPQSSRWPGKNGIEDFIALHFGEKGVCDKPSSVRRDLLLNHDFDICEVPLIESYRGVHRAIAYSKKDIGLYGVKISIPCACGSPVEICEDTIRSIAKDCADWYHIRLSIPDESFLRDGVGAVDTCLDKIWETTGANRRFIIKLYVLRDIGKNLIINLFVEMKKRSKVCSPTTFPSTIADPDVEILVEDL